MNKNVIFNHYTEYLVSNNFKDNIPEESFITFLEICRGKLARALEIKWRFASRILFKSWLYLQSDFRQVISLFPEISPMELGILFGLFYRILDIIRDKLYSVSHT